MMCPSCLGNLDASSKRANLPADRCSCRWRIINTWSGGAGGLVVMFISREVGNAGHSECFKWIHDHTSFSFHEALTRQGYKIEPYTPTERTSSC